MQISNSPLKTITDNLIASIAEFQNDKLEDYKSLYSNNISDLYNSITTTNNTQANLLNLDIASSDYSYLKSKSEKLNIIKELTTIFNKPIEQIELDRKISKTYNSIHELHNNCSDYQQLLQPINTNFFSSIPTNKPEVVNLVQSQIKPRLNKLKLNYRPVEYRKNKKPNDQSGNKVLNLISRLFRLAKVTFKHQSSKG